MLAHRLNLGATKLAFSSPRMAFFISLSGIVANFQFPVSSFEFPGTPIGINRCVWKFGHRSNGDEGGSRRQGVCSPL